MTASGVFTIQGPNTQMQIVLWSMGVWPFRYRCLVESAFASVLKVAWAEMCQGEPCGQPALNCWCSEGKMSLGLPFCTSRCISHLQQQEKLLKIPIWSTNNPASRKKSFGWWWGMQASQTSAAFLGIVCQWWPFFVLFQSAGLLDMTCGGTYLGNSSPAPGGAAVLQQGAAQTKPESAKLSLQLPGALPEPGLLREW